MSARARSWLVGATIIGCLAALTLACYGGVLFRSQQFGYRDAAHFYYPLYERVQAEWTAGRWPLWEPEENGGMPLLGNPTAAVLYPGKIVYAALPYAWAARVYVVMHTLLAFGGMFLLLRSWQTSPAGAAIGALSYAFGVPILFQYCNIIFLVGAAWLPLGFRAADRWLRLGRRSGLLELAVVLAMQVLGGDPESAYVLGLCAAGYALGLGLPARGSAPTRRPARWIVPALALGILGWTLGTVVLAGWLPRLRPAQSDPGKPPLALPWMAWVPLAVLTAWVVAAVFLTNRWRRKHWRSPLGTRTAGLIAAAALAAGLAAVQLLPVLEFTGQSARAAGQGPHDIFPFSLAGIRLVEFIWPNVFGTQFQGNKGWMGMIPLAAIHAEVWVPSLYLGGFSLVLALGALGFRGGPPWRGWLSAVALVTLAASLGKFTGPLWWARWFPEVATWLGPHDKAGTAAIRMDGFLRDGDGGFYWLLATVLPGFRQFRFPSKLLGFTSLALAGLAGLGWDRLRFAPGRARRFVWTGLGLLLLSLVALAVALAEQDRFLAALREYQNVPRRSSFGPVDPPGAFRELRAALVHGVLVLAAGLALTRWQCRTTGAGGAAVCALALTTVDLALANARHVLTVDQAAFESTPKVVRLLAEAERRDPAVGPYRVHRMPLWDPMSWTFEVSTDRVRDFVAWERETIQPKYGLKYGIQYTLTFGVAELYDYEWFFGGFPRTLNPQAAQALAAKPGQTAVVYPRRGFDLWNTRYFVIPAFPAGWDDEHRAFASFLPDTDLIYPDPKREPGPADRERQKFRIEHEDLQILRNHNAYPRAWVVHRARYIEPIRGLERTDRNKPMEELLYDDDYLWHDRTRTRYDPRLLVWIDSDQAAALTGYFPGSRATSSETVTVTHYGPQRVELDVSLDVPGMVILADIYYPGWTLTIDGARAPIYRANRMMRGAAVNEGKHHLVYTYQPSSFFYGGWMTLAALAMTTLLGVAFSCRPVAGSLLPSNAGW